MEQTNSPETTESHARSSLVTGAASGIGKEIAANFSRRGLQVLACDRNEMGGREVDTGSNPPYAEYVLDQASSAGCAAFEAYLEVNGWKLSSAVLCAGFTKHLGVMDTSREEFDEIVAGNFAGTFEMLKIVARNMIKSKIQGSIVVVSSVNAERPLVTQAVYSAAKAAISSLVVSAALELAPYGIRVNTIAPGAILSGMTPAGNYSGIPLQRVGVPDDIAQAAAFLVSDESSYMTGSTVTIDGGLIRVR